MDMEQICPKTKVAILTEHGLRLASFVEMTEIKQTC